MNFKTVWMLWLKGTNFLGMLLLLIVLAIASSVVLAGGVDDRAPDDDPLVVKNVDPDDYQNLDGAWWCHFLKKSRNEIERSYYSVWTFEAAKKLVHIFYSPVHKGFTYDYRWDGKQLILNVGTFETQIHANHALVIEMPELRWKGWLCHRHPTEQWPPDGLQFLDYSRYPWLSGLIEDGPSIMKYRDPKQYKEWEKHYWR